MDAAYALRTELATVLPETLRRRGEGDPMRFQNRVDAGRRLAHVLRRYPWDQPLVLALPRGGVPVGHEVARVLEAPLEVFVARKLGAPLQPDFGIGAVAEGGGLYLDQFAVAGLRLTGSELAWLGAKEGAEIERLVGAYRGGRRLPDLRHRTLILVDDGVETGSTVRAAVQALRTLGPKRLVLATPVASRATLDELRPHLDEIVCLEAPDDLFAIGAWYRDFEPCSDDEASAVLERARVELAAKGDRGEGAERDRPAGGPRVVRIRAGGAQLDGLLTVPADARGLVVFAHGSGSSRRNPRDRHAADALHAAGFATLLFDLLTEDEQAIDARNGALRFDVGLLAQRLLDVTAWANDREDVGALPLGYFGANTGAAAALVAAALRPERVRAIVSRAGRPDLAGAFLARVRAPVLLVVGEHDEPVLELNQAALEELWTAKRLALVPGAGQLFEEPGTLDAATRLAVEWLSSSLTAAPRANAAEPRRV